MLVVAANILIPPMLSGPHESAPAQAELLPSGAPTEAGGVKTYTIDLTAAKPADSSSAPEDETVDAAPVQPSVEIAPAPPPEATLAQTEPAAKPAATVATSPQATADDKPAATVTAPAAPARPSAQASEARTSEPVDNRGGWAVQVASFGVRATSDRVASELKAKGFKAYVTPFQSKGQTMYRVRVGPVEDRSAAEALLKRVKSLHPNAAVVTQ